ncbi:MAG: galactose-1-phosphate uridylyltransferase [Deltaproteobacteria bacterium]|nr:galactose-1-phosphate uridylyltransferase [Deltaproteobacteria bacterium]MCL5277533.1 galactose-1-phosphate uridylyltransferase [Deltaproteobacteria bacterium]
MSEIRFNFVTGDWVIIAPERAKRPEEFVFSHKKDVLAGHVPTCPLCPGNEDSTPPETLRIGKGDGWTVRVVPNKFSVVNHETNIVRESVGVKKFMTGAGFHEVIIDNPAHNASIATLPAPSVEDILTAYKKRFLAFYKVSYIEHVIIFKNHGTRAGTSLQHPHSQIVGTPVIPGRLKSRIEEALRYYDDFGECLYCLILREELRDETRIISQNDSFVSFIPYSALSPFHIWIFPRRHTACFGSIDDRELHDLADILRDTLLRLHMGLGDPDFNYVIHSLSPQECAVKYFHWYLSIVTRVTRTAGFEIGTGMYINPSVPDSSAKFLRDVDTGSHGPSGE